MIENPDLTDLLYERTRQIRNRCQRIWHERKNVSISDSEWMVMDYAAEGKVLISDLPKRFYISRQAVHKLVKGLVEKELIQVEDVQNDKKRKCIVLTLFGRECYDEHQAIKADLMKKMALHIGLESAALLYEILKKDWGISE